MIRVMQRRLRAASEKFQAHGGKLEAEVDHEAELETAPAVAKHRVLKPGFKLKTKACMLTFSIRNITPAHWPRFRACIARLKGKLGARTWAANLEQSPHAAESARPVYHCHAYFIWTDGVGIDVHSLDPFVFEASGPRIDVCRARWGAGGIHRADLQGLWYVAHMKLGTLHTDTN